MQDNGFNIVVGHLHELYYYSNRQKIVRKLEPGLYGLSNRFLDSPCYKVEKGKRELQTCLSEPEIDLESIFSILSDRSRPRIKTCLKQALDCIGSVFYPLCL